MERISKEKRASIAKHLNDGLSVRAINELTGVSKSTVHRISAEIACQNPSVKSGRSAKFTKR